MVLRKLLNVAFILSLSVGLSNCASKKSKDSLTEAEGYSENYDLYADSDSKKAGLLKTVHFAFDSSKLSEAEHMVLDGNAAFLSKHSNIHVQVEGHADERGSEQYNLALGERRAKAVRDYLVAKGIEAKRVTTISYGKQRPLSYGHAEEDWMQNRRGNFVITNK